MKLNLSIDNSFDLRAGYKNITPFPKKPPEGQSFSEEYIQGDIFNLDVVCRDGEAEEIILNNILNLKPAPQIKDQLEHYANKLKIGGLLVIITPDVFQAAKNYTFEQIDIGGLNALLFGDPTNPFTLRKCALDYNVISHLFELTGFKIGRARMNNYTMMIEGIKQ